MQLARFPRVSLAHLPTPLERLDRLSEALGGPEIWIKRDDCTGLSTGGNKTRKLEFLIGEAEAAGVDVVLTTGAVQSNHARQTAASAAKRGLACHLVLNNQNRFEEANYLGNGNILLDRLHGATVEIVATPEDAKAAMEAAAGRFRASGRVVYVAPTGGSTPTGALGYVDCAMETLGQANAARVAFDGLIHATGSAGTQAGLIAGLKGMNAGLPVIGISVSTERALQEAKVLDLARKTAALFDYEDAVRDEDVLVDDSYIGKAYGYPTDDGLTAMRMFAELEGLILDPVYTGKAAAGLVDIIRKGRFSKGDRVLFLHTEGQSAIFAYDRAFAPDASR